ncbi:hypothetical protein D3C77_695100 [compost metagenome]
MSVRVGVVMRGRTLRSDSTSIWARSIRLTPRNSPLAGLRRMMLVIDVSPRMIGVSRVMVSSLKFLAGWACSVVFMGLLLGVGVTAGISTSSGWC